MSRFRSVKIPSPRDPLVDDEGFISKPWYQYMLTSDHLWRGKIDVRSTESTASIIKNHHTTIIDSTAGVVHELEAPRDAARCTIVCQIPSTQGGSVTVACSTDVAIGPGGENAIQFPTSASTYDLIELVGANSTQYYIVNQTTNVSIVASS